LHEGWESLNKPAIFFYNHGKESKIVGYFMTMETPTFLYKPNFCAECGEKIEREAWHFWTSRRFCDNCEPVFRTVRLLPPGLAALVLFCGGLFFGQMGQGAAKPVLLAAEQKALPIEKVPVQPVRQVPVASPAALAANVDDNLPKNLPPANLPRPSATENLRAVSAPEAVYVCGARTQKGTPCSRRVKAAGMRCWQHAGKASMLEK
jgi:hypothetical protein